MSNVKVSSKQVGEREAPKNPRSEMPAPTIYSRFEKTGFVTTDPAVVNRLFKEKIYSTLLSEDHIRYVYAADETERIKTVLGMK